MALRPGLRPGRGAFRGLAAAALALGGCAGAGPGRPERLTPVARGQAVRLLAAHAPELRYDRRESSPATDVRALTSRAVLRDAAGRVVARAPSPDGLARGTVLDAPSTGGFPRF